MEDWREADKKACKKEFINALDHNCFCGSVDIENFAFEHWISREDIWAWGYKEWKNKKSENQNKTIKISKVLEDFQSCNCCGRHNKRGPGTEQMYKSLCKNIREYIIDGMCIRLCEDCAKELRNQLNEILE